MIDKYEFMIVCDRIVMNKDEKPSLSYVYIKERAYHCSVNSHE